MFKNLIVVATTCVALFAFSFNSAYAGGDGWKEKMIADALTAAPPAVTHDATIYAWDAKGQMIMLRAGTGSYVCAASGLNSTRIGKPPKPGTRTCKKIFPSLAGFFESFPLLGRVF